MDESRLEALEAKVKVLEEQLSRTHAALETLYGISRADDAALLAMVDAYALSETIAVQQGAKSSAGASDPARMRWRRRVPIPPGRSRATASPKP